VSGLSHDDRVALMLAATVLGRYNRTGLAERLRNIAHAPEEQTAPPPPQEQPRRHLAGRPADDVAEVAMVVRALGDLDVYSLFMEAQRVRPSSLTAEVWRRAEQARHGQK